MDARRCDASFGAVHVISFAFEAGGDKKQPARGSAPFSGWLL